MCDQRDSAPNRIDRCWIEEDDQRTAGERDRDRILYSSALRRLAGVTQVASATEGTLFHNRLTHTLEVAQIAHRLSQRLMETQGDRCGDLDPNVAEAAALGHDLGHPPFGHIAEQELDRLVTVVEAVDDGFEGNAQSFRTLTKLSIRRPQFLGLNLTRATLDAVLKYPWQRLPKEAQGARPLKDLRADERRRRTKWGAFGMETEEFRWSRELHRAGGGADDGMRSLEAEIMDWADDIAYAVHDVEDFYRAGVVPLDRLTEADAERTAFLNAAVARWNEEDLYPRYRGNRAALEDTLDGLLDLVGVASPYHGTVEERADLRSDTALLIRRYIFDTQSLVVSAPGTVGPRARHDQQSEMEIAILKELIWYYVIRNPALASQQEGHRRIIRELFEVYLRAAQKDRSLLPPGFRGQLERWEVGIGDEQKATVEVRVVTDLICSMTEPQALAMYNRLSGHAPGSILDVIVR